MTSFSTPSYPMQPPLQPALYLVPTPIGNLADITLRGLHVLQHADLVLAEDTRVTAKLLSLYGFKNKLQNFTDYSDAGAVQAVIAKLHAGLAVALVSDAGTPLISDPGYKLVQAVVQAGLSVVPLPGANALLPALQLSALPSDAFVFLGFLPNKTAARRAALAKYKTVEASLVLYESPNRVADLLADAAAVLGNRPAALCRELTKMYETAVRFSLADIPALDDVRGECVVVIAPPVAGTEAEETLDLDAVLKHALAQHSLAQAVQHATAQTGLPRNMVYKRALVLAKENNEA